MSLNFDWIDGQLFRELLPLISNAVQALKKKKFGMTPNPSHIFIEKKPNSVSLNVLCGFFLCIFNEVSI